MSKILECCNERIAALSENISRGVDIFGDKGMFVSQIYQILHALWIFTTLRSQWIPTEKDCAYVWYQQIAKNAPNPFLNQNPVSKVLTNIALYHDDRYDVSHIEL